MRFLGEDIAATLRLSLAIAIGGATGAMAQGLNQTACRIVIERTGENVSAVAIAQTNLATKARFSFQATKISASGQGASEQKGDQFLPSKEVTVLSQVRFRLDKDGWVDFELNVTEQLTGATCHAEETVSAAWSD